MIGIARPTLLLLFACLTWIGPLAAETPALTDVAPASGLPIEPVAASHGMVVAQEGRAARIGVEVLEQGGNAVDAAVATGFALAVTYPRAGNIGGGGYMLIHLAQGSIDTAIDYRETAPAATRRTIFLDEHGEADPHKSQDSALAIGVPGTVAGLALAHAKYGSGKFTLAQLIAPAIALAGDGKDLPRTRRPCARSWSDTTPARPGRYAFCNRPRGTAGILSRRNRGQARQRGSRGGRHHDARRSRALPTDRAHAHFRELSRLSHRIDAAVLVRRRGSDRDAQYSRRI